MNRANVCVLAAVVSFTAAAPPDPTVLQVDGLGGAPVIDHLKPRFSYKIDCGASFSSCPRGLTQTSKQITVFEAASGKSMWEASLAGNETWVTYGGTALSAHTDYTWSVSWNASSNEQSKAVISKFSVGIAEESDWFGADWVQGPSGNEAQVRGEFTPSSRRPVRRATAYVSAPGGFSFFLNGMEVQSVPASDVPNVPSTQHGVMPWLQFERTVLWQAHDVTELLATGGDANAIGVLLGAGWWVPKNHGPRTVRVAVVVEDDSGAREVFVTGVKGGSGPAQACAVVDEHDTATLGCPAGQAVLSVPFASFGTPSGGCDGGGPLSRNSSCDAPGVREQLESMCVGRASCPLAPSC